MRRTSHIALRVPLDKVESAIAHYTSLLGVKREIGEDGSVGLVGGNFTIWVDVGESDGQVMQEFAGSESSVDKQRFLDAGCEVFDESKYGFHVRDPFGMVYHVWVETDEKGPE